MQTKTDFLLAGLKTLVATAQILLPLISLSAAEYRVPTDYATIQEAVDAAQDENNADNQIVLEDSVSYTASAIDVTGFDEDKRLVIRPDTSLKRATIASQNGLDYALYVHAASYVTVQDLDIVRFTTNRRNLVEVEAADEVLIHRCRLGSVWSTRGSGGTVILHSTAANLIVRNCIFFSNTPGTFDYGIRYMTDTALGNWIRLYNNVVADYAVGGIRIASGGDEALVILRNNVVVNHPSAPSEPYAYISEVFEEVDVFTSHNTAFASADRVQMVVANDRQPISGPNQFLRFNRNDVGAAFVQTVWPLEPPFAPNQSFFRLRLNSLLHNGNPATRGQTVAAGAPDPQDRAVEDDIKSWPRPAGDPAHTDRGAHQMEVDPVVATIEQLAHGTLIRFNGFPDRTYGIEASDELGHWERLGDARADFAGIGQFLDDELPRPVQRLYRVVWP